MEFTETVGMIPETRRMRGSSYPMAGGQMFVSEIDDTMHSSDQFRDLGFRLLSLAEPSSSVPDVPALSKSHLLAMFFVICPVGVIALRPVHQRVRT